jgi:hypothetical protein
MFAHTAFLFQSYVLPHFGNLLPSHSLTLLFLSNNNLHNLSLCQPPSCRFSHSANLIPSYFLPLLTSFPHIPSYCQLHPIIFSHSANCMQDPHVLSFYYLHPGPHVLSLHSAFCILDPHVLSLYQLHAGPSCSFTLRLHPGPPCSVTLLFACRTLMFSHSATGMQDPHVMSRCYLHTGPSCSLTLLIACRTLMFSHSAQDPHVLSLC